MPVKRVLPSLEYVEEGPSGRAHTEPQVPCSLILMEDRRHLVVGVHGQRISAKSTAGSEPARAFLAAGGNKLRLPRGGANRSL